MTDFNKLYNIYPTESGENEDDDNSNTDQIKRVNASVNENYSKNYVRITIKIPQLKTAFNWRKFTREVINGSTTKATYHGTRVQFEFILNQGTPNEKKYEFTSREPLHGPVEYTKSYLKYKDEYVIWFIHKSLPW